MSTTGEAQYSLGQSQGVRDYLSKREVVKDAAFVIPYLRPESRILDVGCGPGSITCGFAEMTESGNVVGMDQSLTAIENAQKTAKEKGLTNIEFKIGDVSGKLPFDDAVFDIAFCHQVLVYLADPAHAMAEMKRVVKPGGVIAVREALSNIWYPSSPRLDELIMWIHKAVQRPESIQGRPGNHLHIYARQAGFEASAIHCSVSGQVYVSDEERMQASQGIRYLLGENGPLRQRALDAGATVEELAALWAELEIWSKTPDAFMDFISQEIVCQV